MEWKISFYTKSIKKEVDKLEKSIKSKFIAILNKMLEEGPDLGMPYTKAMGKGLLKSVLRAKQE